MGLWLGNMAAGSSSTILTEHGRLPHQDAPILAEQLGGDVTPQGLLARPRHRAYVRLLTDGPPSRPFSMEMLAPPSAVPPASATRARPRAMGRRARARRPPSGGH